MTYAEKYLHECDRLRELIRRSGYANMIARVAVELVDLREQLEALKTPGAAADAGESQQTSAHAVDVR